MSLLLSHFMKLLPLLLAIFLSSKSIAPFLESAAQTIETDKETLILFKSQISSESSISLSSWDKNFSPCNWTGVTCNTYGQRVIGLNLSSLGLAGSITPHIGNLSFLESLQLQKNQFTGTIPDEIFNLFSLRVLNLSYNSLRSSIPSSISRLTQLTVVDLSMNQITGKVPQEISSLSRLQILNLGRNLLRGAIPSSIANLSSLEDLILRSNSFSGMIPSDLSRLRNLKVLDLAINNLTGTVPSSIYNMSSLVNLALASNQLWGTIPGDIGFTLPNLLLFITCFNKFTGTIPSSLHNLTNIKVIRLAHNFHEGTVPPGLGNLPFLEMYNIRYNRIASYGDDGLEFITSLTNSSYLTYLAIDGNLLQGVIPESIGNLSKDLTILYMGSNQIYGSIPASISGLKSLTLLNLSYSSISGEIPPEISQLENLEILDLAGNEITGRVSDSFGNLKKLYQIDLSKNQLVGQIPTTFWNFHRLRSIDLSNNFLTGNLSEEIGVLESVVTIDLSNNSLSGHIPNSIRNCKSLEELYIARNKFSGPIPIVFGEVKRLENLDLSYNKFSGSIPFDLEKLEALQSLNLAFNDLEGVIPCGGVFTNLSRVQLQGNPELSLNLVCHNARAHGRRPVEVYIVAGTMIAALFLCFSVGLFFYLRRSKAKIDQSSSLIKKQHRMVSYHELRQATGNFNEQNLIGHGGFGSVYKGYLGDGSAVAIKVIDITQTGFQKSFLGECEALRNVRHRNLVQLITSCSSVDLKNTEFLALVYELLGNGNLQDWIQGKRKKEDEDGLNLVERLNVAIDVASAIDYLHNDCEVPVVHCDLKPSNIFLDEDMTAKVGDFGLAKSLIENMSGPTSISSTYALKGSIGYIPPEYGLGLKPSTTGDVYSFGVMLLELFTGKSPIDDSFTVGKNLVGWVQSVFPANIEKVLDPELLSLMDNFDSDSQIIKPEAQHYCLITILGIGLACTVASLDNRISVRNTLSKLQAARNNLLNGGSTWKANY